MKCEKEGFLKWLPGLFRPAVRNFRLLNRDYGHFRTMRERASVDREGRPLPWYTYPAIEFVKQLDFSNRDIFEYGAGYSSLFYAARCRRITSVEDNRRWFETIRPRAPANCEILWAATPEAYGGAILQYPHAFDVVIIDGSYREQCCVPALQKLKPGGMIILDNSDHHKECVAILAQADLIQVDMAGFGPQNGYVWATSFFLSREFNFQSAQPHRPTLSVGP